MMHVVGSTPKSPKRSDGKTILEPRLVEIQKEEDTNETSIVTIEVPAQVPEQRPTESSVFNIVSVAPTTSDKPSSVHVTQGIMDLIQSVNLTPSSRSQSAPTQHITYTINNKPNYLQPYELLSTAPAPRLRRPATPKLPWLECGGGLAAFTIISGVIAIDGLKQSPTTPSPTAQQQQPTIARLPNAPSTPQVSVSELLSTGRTLPVPTGAMNFPQQIAMNSSAQDSSLNLGSAEMNSIVVQKDLGNTQQIPQPSVTPRKAIAAPEKLPQAPIKTVQIPVQRPIQTPVQLPAQPPIQQSSPPNNPTFTPQATQPIEPPSQAMPPSQSQEAQFLEVPTSPVQPTATSSAIPPLQNDPSISPTTLKPIRSSTLAKPTQSGSTPSETMPPLSSNSPIIIEASPQAALSSVTADDAIRLEVSKL
jgi:hypothetical protein